MKNRRIKQMIERRNYDTTSLRQTKVPFANIEKQFNRTLDGRRAWMVTRWQGEDELNYWDTYAEHWIPVARRKTP